MVSGGGGGGRIEIYCKNVNKFKGEFSVQGGFGSEDGCAGSFYICESRSNLKRLYIGEDAYVNAITYAVCTNENSATTDQIDDDNSLSGCEAISLMTMHKYEVESNSNGTLVLTSASDEVPVAGDILIITRPGGGHINKFLPSLTLINSLFITQSPIEISVDDD
ncbi:MAG: hypothetical protein AB7F75_05875 [Planctomycetota bacterium]